jgi:transposase
MKLDSVVTDVLGKSARATLAALIAGQRDPKVLAELALGRMRPKVGALEQALVGRFCDHHARLCSKMLAHIDSLTATIEELTGEIQTQIEPFQHIRKQLRTIPGVSDRLAENLIAETGADMSRFPTPQQLASWAGMCPGNNESAGKHFTGRTRKGDRWLRGALGEAAAAAASTKHTYLSARYRRLASRRGKKRAKVALGHDILIAAWYIMRDGVDYADLGADYFDTHVIDPRLKAARLAQQLQALGYRVTLEHAA